MTSESNRLNNLQKTTLAIKLKPNFTHAYSNILFTSFYFEKDDPKYYLLQAKKFRSSIKPIKENSIKYWCSYLNEFSGW